MPEWAVQLEQSDKHHTALLRGIERVQVCETGDFVWVRGHYVEAIEPQVTALPGTHFSVLPDGQLLPKGKRVPQGYLPKREWHAIVDWVSVELPVASWATGQPPTHSLELVAAKPSQQVDASAIILKPMGWLSFANTTAAVRLKPLRFAMSDDGRVVVFGTPLPPLPGVRLAVHGTIAVPAGQHWSPAIDASVVRRTFGPHDAGIVLWHCADNWEFIPDSAFVNATRSAVRESVRSLREVRE